MAKASDVAKEKIIADLGSLYPTSKLIDKKLYVNLTIEGEEVQIAITLTAPKTKIDFADSGSNASLSELPHPSIDKEKLEKEVENIFDFFKL